MDARTKAHILALDVDKIFLEYLVQGLVIDPETGEVIARVEIVEDETIVEEKAED